MSTFALAMMAFRTTSFVVAALRLNEADLEVEGGDSHAGAIITRTRPLSSQRSRLVNAIKDLVLRKRVVL